MNTLDQSDSKFNSIIICPLTL